MNLAELLQDQNPWWRDGAIRLAREFPVRRDLQPEILRRVLTLDNPRATVLLGPRQIGKTILLLQVADDLLDKGWPPQNLTYFDFSDERVLGQISAREIVEARPADRSPDHPQIFLLDEIRGASHWDRWLKQAVDKRVGRIVATDSAAGLLRAGAVESGLGRWDEVHIEALSFREFIRFNKLQEEEKEEEALSFLPRLLEEYLSRGGFPAYCGRGNYPDVRRTLRSDIADRAILRDLSGLGVDVDRARQLFVYLIQASGAELNAQARADDLAADARSIREWTRLLTDTMLIAPLERFIRHAAAGLRARPKLFAADPGLVVAFSPSPVQNEDTRARAFEAAVFRHLREVARKLDAQLSYFRHRDELELDFVVEGPGLPLTGIEVKSGRRIRPEQVDRIQRAGEELGAERLLLVHGSVIDPKLDKVKAVSVSRFLLNPFGWIKGDLK